MLLEAVYYSQINTGQIDEKASLKRLLRDIVNIARVVDAAWQIVPSRFHPEKLPLPCAAPLTHEHASGHPIKGKNSWLALRRMW